MAKKILIVEDEQFIADMYKLKFTNEGYEVFVAYDGEEGLDMALKELPDMILLDVVMPRLNGYQVLGALKKHELTKKIKVYILSNLGQNNEIEEGLKAGADGYFVKANLTPSQLADNVRKILAGQPVKPSSGLIIKKTDQPAAAPPSRGVKVLLIEDQDSIIDMYRMRLENAGFEVVTAKNGAWGLKAAREQAFAVIVMDIVMPEMNGYDMLKALKQDSKNKAAPVIVLSNSAQDRDVQKALDCGADCFLLKAKITPARLIKEIEKLLEVKIS